MGSWVARPLRLRSQGAQHVHPLLDRVIRVPVSVQRRIRICEAQTGVIEAQPSVQRYRPSVVHRDAEAQSGDPSFEGELTRKFQQRRPDACPRQLGSTCKKPNST